MDTLTRAGWWRHDTVRLPAPTTQGPVQAGTAGGGASFWALMAFTFVLLVSPQSFIPALAPLHFALLAAGAAGTLYLLGGLTGRGPALRLSREMRIAAGLVVWAVVTLPFSYWPGGSVTFMLDIYLKALIIFWLLGNVVNTPARLRTVAWVLSLLAVPLALSGVWSFFSGGFLAEELSRGANRIEGYNAPLTDNPNDLALMLNLILPLTLALFFDCRKLWLKCLLATVACLDMVAIVATYSRAGFLTLAVVCFVYLLYMLKNRRGTALLLAGLVLCSVPLLPSSYLHRLVTITEIGRASSRARTVTTVG